MFLRSLNLNQSPTQKKTKRKMGMKKRLLTQLISMLKLVKFRNEDLTGHTEQEKHDEPEEYEILENLRITTLGKNHVYLHKIESNNETQVNFTIKFRRSKYLLNETHPG